MVAKVKINKSHKFKLRNLEVPYKTCCNKSLVKKPLTHISIHIHVNATKVCMHTHTHDTSTATLSLALSVTVSNDNAYTKDPKSYLLRTSASPEM